MAHALDPLVSLESGERFAHKLRLLQQIRGCALAWNFNCVKGLEIGDFVGLLRALETGGFPRSWLLRGLRFPGFWDYPASGFSRVLGLAGSRVLPGPNSPGSPFRLEIGDSGVRSGVDPEALLQEAPLS